MPSNLVLATVGLVAAGMIGYCIYFDHQRRSDPLYRRKLRERRMKGKKPTEPPRAQQIFMSEDDLKRFFVQQLRLSETLLQEGQLEAGAEHLANALGVCNDGLDILQTSRAILPAGVYEIVLERLQGSQPCQFDLGGAFQRTGEAGLDNLD